jgi:hypothetical protein
MLAQPIFKWDWLYATAINEDHVDVSNGDLAHRRLCWLYISIALCVAHNKCCFCWQLPWIPWCYSPKILKNWSFNGDFESGGELLKLRLLDTQLLDTFGSKSIARHKIAKLFESSKSWLNLIRTDDENIVNCSNPVFI